MSQTVELPPTQLAARYPSISQRLRTPLLACTLLTLSACSTPRGSGEPWVYILSRHFYPAAFEDGELFASIAQDGSSESAVLVAVAVFALPFVLDTVFLPIAVPHDLMLVE